MAGGVGSGKTRAGTVEALRMPPGSNGAVIAPTYPMLRDATLRTFLELCDRAGILESFNKKEMVAELAGGRTVLFRSGEHPDRLRGPNLGWFWLDEAAMMTEPVWKIMLGRLRERPARAWATSTPRGKNWLHRVLVDHPAADTRFRTVRAPTQSNVFLPPDFVDTLLAAYDPAFASQEVGGEFLDDTLGQLIPDWHVDRIPTLKRPDMPGGPRWMSCDLGEGGGRDSTVILLGDKWGILDGLASPWVGPAEAASLIAQRLRLWDVPQHRIIYDAGGGRGLDIEPYLAQHGITEARGYRGSRTGGDQFANRRSRMGWRLRQRLDPERPRPVPPLVYPSDWKRSVFDPPPEPVKHVPQAPFCVPEGWGLWDTFRKEALALKWFHSKKQIALEPKETLIATLGHSPNVIDAVLMRFDLDDEREAA